MQIKISCCLLKEIDQANTIRQMLLNVNNINYLTISSLLQNSSKYFGEPINPHNYWTYQFKYSAINLTLDILVNRNKILSREQAFYYSHVLCGRTLFIILMSLLESMLTTRRNPLRPNHPLEPTPTEPLLKQTKVTSYQSKPKRSLIRINPRKFPNDFFDIRQTIVGKRRPKFLSELGSLPKVDRLGTKNISDTKQPDVPKNQEIFKKTSFFKYSEELSEKTNSSDQRNTLSRSEAKKSTDKRWKRTADPSSREPLDSEQKNKDDLCESSIFNGTFSKNFFSKELSTDVDSPTCDDITNIFNVSNKRYEKEYFHIGNLEAIQLKNTEAYLTERTDHQLRIRRRTNLVKPIECLPPISYR